MRAGDAMDTGEVIGADTYLESSHGNGGGDKCDESGGDYEGYDGENWLPPQKGTSNEVCIGDAMDTDEEARAVTDHTKGSDVKNNNVDNDGVDNGNGAEDEDGEGDDFEDDEDDQDYEESGEG